MPSRRPKLLLAVTVPQSLILIEGQAKRFKDLGYETHLISSPGDEADAIAQKEGIRHHAINIPRNISPLRDFLALWKLIFKVAELRPQILNTGTPKAGTLLSIAGWLLHVPVRIYTIRGLRYDSESGWLRRILISLEKITSSCAQTNICISKSMMDMAYRDLGGPRSKYVLIGNGSSNGINLERFTPTSETETRAKAFRQRYEIPQDAIVIGYLGRLNKRKGVEELANAWITLRKRHPQVYLLIGGAREDAQKPSEHFFETIENDPKIIETGHLDEVEVFMSSIDIFILPAYWEGFGNVLIQAAAMGKPIVTTHTIGCIDATKENYNATWIPPKAPQAIESALTAYIENEQLRIEHGRNGMEWAKRFDRYRVWQGIHSLYQTLLSKNFPSVI